MSKIISMFAALVLGAASISAAQAASSSVPLRGQPFFKGLENPGQLADLIAANLKQDNSGNTKLDSKACRTPGNGSCARPLDYLESVKEADPKGTVALKTVADLPAFLRTLRKESAPPGRYILACLRPIGGGNYKQVLGCTERPFKPGETIWVNPVSNRPLFASDCTNPIKGPAPLKNVCAEIHLFAREGDTVMRQAVLGSPEFKDDCFAIKKAGETEFHIPWRDACESEHCTFAASEAFLNKKAWNLASYELEPGEYVVRVPIRFTEKNSAYVTTFCIERTKMVWPEFPKDVEAKAKEVLANKPQEPVRGTNPDAYAAEYAKYVVAYQKWRDTYAAWYSENKKLIADYTERRDQWNEGHSDSVNVWPNAYRVGSDGVPRATIYYSEAEVSAIEPVKMYWRWGVWLQEHPQVR